MRVHLTKDGGVGDFWTFSWARWCDGYHLEEREISPAIPQVRPNPEGKCVLVSPRATKSKPEVYRPLDDAPGISREFSAIETPQDALQFANKYGLLGLSDVPRMQLHRDSNGAEWVVLWLEEAQRLRHVYRLWDLCESKDTRGLAEMITWLGGAVVVKFSRQIRRCIADSTRNRQWFNTWKRGDLMGPAKLFIAEEYNSQIHLMASPLLLLDSKDNLRPHSSPGNLLGAIWLEFGEVVSGVRKQTICEYCGRVMDVTNNRRHKRVHRSCSLRIRMARYRQTHKA